MYKDNRIVACIIVRMKSQRLKEKAIKILVGKPMVVHLIERIKRSKYLDKIYICTSTNPSDAVLLDIAKHESIEGFAGSERDVLGRLINVAEIEKADVVVRITGDNPLTDPKIMDNMIKAHIDNDYEYTRTRGLPLGINSDVISVKALYKCRDLIENPEDSEYMMLYLNDPKNFKVQILNPEKDLERPTYFLSVDTADDFKVMSSIFERFYNKDKNFMLGEVIKFLDDNPEIAELNNNVPVKLPGGKSIPYKEFRNKNPSV